jgi:nucleotide-binding universal stress UspA family protein
MNIVVGVDGSLGSRAALEYAAAEARRRSAALTVVSVFYPPLLVAPYGVAAPMTDAEIAEEVRAETQRFIDAVLGEHPTGQPVRLIVLGDRSPAHALIRAAEDAELLVVGHRGLGAIGSALGSVALRCVLHASRPVTVVPPARAVAPNQCLAESTATSGR